MKCWPGSLPLVLLVFVACKQPAPGGDPSADHSGDPRAEPSTGAAGNTAGAVTTASAPSAANASAAEAKPDKAPPRNILLITIDSLRADMPWTGYPREIAPNLTKLAAQSVVYPNSYSASSYTAKSVSALFTGRYPSAVYRSGWFFASFSESNLFFTELLQQRGVRTMGGHGHSYFDRGKQLNQGFDVWQLVPGITFDNSTDRYVTSDKMTDMAVGMLSDPNNTSKQFFMWLHYMDPHDVYIQHEESPKFGKKARDRYDSEVFFTDLHVGRLLDYCRKQPWWDNTGVIISADHGEAFGEHGMYKHAFELWEVLTRVPLLIYVPGAKPRTIEQRRVAIDLAPTIVELMGIEQMPESFMGRSLVPEVFGAEPDNREPIVLDLPEDHNNPDRRAIIQGDYKLLVRGDGSRSLFNLKEDPGEEKDLIKQASAKETLQQMSQLYTQTSDKMQSVAPFGGMKLRSGKKANGPEGPSDDVAPTGAAPASSAK